jgi:putrescine transport system substrate-binding protein
MRNGLLPLAVGWCALLSLQGCSERASPAGSDDAQVLNVYNWTDFMDPAVIADFERQFGIHVNYDVYGSNEELETKLLLGHSNYDIVVPGGSFFERDVQAGLYHRLDKKQLSNLDNIDPEAARNMTVYDPDHAYGVPYMWLTTTGIGYDAQKLAEHLPNAPTDSWALLYDPTLLAQLKDCGVSILDAPSDVVSTVLAYLGKNPNSESPEDLKAAEQTLLAIRPYVRYIDIEQYFSRLANGEICLALGWAGDIATARERARESGHPRPIVYVVPKEGALDIFDVLAIPADAPHLRNAHLFLNFVLRPDIAARNSNLINYATPVMGARELLRENLRDDAGVYPPPEVRERLTVMRAHSRGFTRLLNRTWTRFKFGN